MKKILVILLYLYILISVSWAATVTVFTSPDSSYNVLEEFLSKAGDIYLASYTFDSPYIADLLINKKSNVIILLEKSPAGGLSLGEVAVLCHMAGNGIDIFLYDGPARFHHAKYIISGTRVLASSENFGISGYPKNNQGNRGWGAVIDDYFVSKQLLEVFNNDLKESERLTCEGENKLDYSQNKGNYKPVFKPKTYYNQSVSLITAPGAVDGILDIINSANSSIYTEQFYIYRYWEDEDNGFVEEMIKKSMEGIEVKTLLDNTWYNMDKNNKNSNYNTDKYLNKVASDEKLNLKSKISELNVEKIHTKGLIIDNKKVLISTINWNLNSPQNNREIGIVIEGSSASYFTEVFNHDFNYNKKESATNNTDLYQIGLILSLLLIVFIYKIIK